jgi:2'-5' RNA ligase
MARLFAAIWLPSEVEAHLDENIDGARTAHPHLRWVPPQRWHITLEFLGDCGPHELNRQLDRWERRASRSGPLQLRLAGAGTFPAKAWMARVLWIGLDGDLAGLRKVAAYGTEPHLTLARTRERTDLTNLSHELSRYAGPTWTAGEVTLVESHQRGSNERGPRYEPLMAWPLGRATG